VNIDLIEQHGFKLLDLIEETSRVYIWKAIQTTLDRAVFLVILKEDACTDPLEIKYFLQIAQQFAKLKSESLAAVFDIVSEDDIHYVIMEYVDGETLDELLQHRGPLDFKHTIQVALSITGCLKQLWNSSRIIHRNIKGSTIRYDTRGIAKITDFSLAVIASPEFNPAVIDKGHVLGAPSFLSPEQSRADETIVFQSDMYALGALLYYISTGRAPFSELDAPTILRAHLEATLPPPHQVNPELPPIFSRLLHKLMMKDPQYRYRNWEEIQHDLHCILDGKEPVCARPNLERSSTIKTDFSEPVKDQEQSLSFKIKTKKRNEYLSSMQDKHVSHHHAADEKSQQFKLQLICWALLALWLTALFWFRAVIQAGPQNNEPLPPSLTQGNPTGDTPEMQTNTWLAAMPPDVTIDTLDSAVPDRKALQTIPEDLLENLAMALARNDPAAAIA
jgi:serine/threonine-protein kinase